MKQKLICLVLSVTLLLGVFSINAFAVTSKAPLTFAEVTAVEGKTLTFDVPVAIDFTDALGININIRLNPNLVSSASIVSPASCLSNTMYTANQDGDKYKIAIASAEPISNEGRLFTLRLKLKVEAAPVDELCKVLQVKVNDVITWQAANRVLLTGVTDGGKYKESVTITFNEGTATLNGAAFASGSTVSAIGEYTLIVTDTGKDVRTVRFNIIPDSIKGDMNNSGVVDSNDAIYLLRHTLDKVKYPITQSGDMNGDGAVNSNDAIYLLRYTLNPTKYPLS